MRGRLWGAVVIAAVGTMLVAPAEPADADEVHFRNQQRLRHVRILEEWPDRLVIDPAPLARRLEDQIQGLVDEYQAEHGSPPPTLKDPSPALADQVRRAIEAYRGENQRYPSSLGQLEGLPPIPRYVAVDYNPRTGRVEVRTTVPELPGLPTTPPYIQVAYDADAGQVSVSGRISTVPKQGIERIVLGEGRSRQEFSLPPDRVSGLEVFPGMEGASVGEPSEPSGSSGSSGPPEEDGADEPASLGTGIPAAAAIELPTLPPSDGETTGLRVRQGDVWVDGGDGESPASSGDVTWNAGDVVRTGPGGEAFVLLADGAAVRLRPSTEVVLGATRMGNARVELVSGHLEVAKDGYVEVEIGPDAVLRSDGGAFGVMARAGGAELASGRGHAVADVGEGRVWLASGQRVRVATGADRFALRGNGENRLAVVALPRPGLRLELVGSTGVEMEDRGDDQRLDLPENATLVRPNGMAVTVHVAGDGSQVRFGRGESAVRIPIPAGRTSRVAESAGVRTLLTGDTAWVTWPE